MNSEFLYLNFLKNSKTGSLENVRRLHAAGSEIGTIQVGKRADLIGVAGNPLEAINNIRNVRLVMRDGQVIIFNQ